MAFKRILLPLFYFKQSSSLKLNGNQLIHNTPKQHNHPTKTMAMELNNYTIAAIAVTTFAIVLAAAYLSGALDPVIKEVGIMFFKAKAEAEAKKLQAQGMKQGEDFTKGV